MPELNGDIDRPRSPGEQVEVLRERLPTPRHAFVERGAGDVLDALHELDEPALATGRTGAKPTPQLPVTTVATPCTDEGSSTSSQVACPS